MASFVMNTAVFVLLGLAVLLAATCHGATIEYQATSEAPTIPPTTEPPDTGLKCYACYGVGPKNDCNNYTAYEKAHESDDKKFGDITLKSCALPYNTTCYVIKYTDSTGELAQLRDCSDDVHFGFPKNFSDRLNILKNLPTNNSTKCAWTGKTQICLTKCNSGAYCNGPQIAGAVLHQGTFVTTLVATVLLVVMMRGDLVGGYVS